MQTRILPVASRSEYREWIQFPRTHVYGDESPWVSPLDRDLARSVDVQRNPYFRHAVGALLLARSATGQVVGRVLAHVNATFNQHQHERAVLFGFFECVDDAEVAARLVDAVRAFGRARGCEVIRGPFNLALSQDVGILTDGFEHPPTLDGTYTAPYYPHLLEATGLARTYPMTTYRLDLAPLVTGATPLPSRGDRSGNITIRSVRTRFLEREVETIRTIANAAFAHTRFFAPITAAEFAYQLMPYRAIFDPGLMLFAEERGEPVGFLIANPDYNRALKTRNGKATLMTYLRLAQTRHEARHAVMTYAAVSPRAQGKGILRLLHTELLRRLIRRGTETLSYTWAADVNGPALAVVSSLGAQPMHRLTLYEGCLGRARSRSTDASHRDVASR